MAANETLNTCDYVASSQRLSTRSTNQTWSLSRVTQQTSVHVRVALADVAVQSSTLADRMGRRLTDAVGVLDRALPAGQVDASLRSVTAVAERLLQKLPERVQDVIQHSSTLQTDYVARPVESLVSTAASITTVSPVTTAHVRDVAGVAELLTANGVWGLTSRMVSGAAASVASTARLSSRSRSTQIVEWVSNSVLRSVIRSSQAVEAARLLEAVLRSVSSSQQTIQSAASLAPLLTRSETYVLERIHDTGAGGFLASFTRVPGPGQTTITTLGHGLHSLAPVDFVDGASMISNGQQRALGNGTPLVAEMEIYSKGDSSRLTTIEELWVAGDVPRTAWAFDGLRRNPQARSGHARFRFGLGSRRHDIHVDLIGFYAVDSATMRELRSKVRY